LKEFIDQAVAPHVRTIGVLATHFAGDLPGTSIHKQEVLFSNGSRIIALPANPDTARSYEGDVLLDEFGFHQDSRKIYEAVEPSITRGYRLSIISTPNGQQGTYFDLANEAGLVDGRPRSQRWSAHKTNLLEAIAHGCKDRNGNPLVAAQIRIGCIDEEMWLQEYCCEFINIASQWISPELFSKNVS
jgi:phage FluMu gp28-like protein